MSIVETMRFICSGCGYRARIPSSYTGKVILCPGCKQMEIASADGGDSTGDTVRVARVTTAQGSASFSVPDAEGNLRFTCGGCGYGAKLSGTYAGKAISCPQCKAPQLIPPLAKAEGNVEKKLQPPAPAPTPAPTQAPIAAPQNEVDLSFDDETTSDPNPLPVAKKTIAQVAAHDPVDDISFDQEPLAQATAETTSANTVKPPSTRTTSPASGPRHASSGQTQASKPTSGKIVRRGSNTAMPAMPKSTADDVENDESDESDKSDSVKIAKPLPEWVQKVKQPKIMASIGGGLAVFITLIVLISAWSNVSSAVKGLEEKVTLTEELNNTLKKGKIDAEVALSETKSERDRLKKSDADMKAELTLAKTGLAELGEKFKQAEAKKTEEYDLRKKMEDKYDENFAKLINVEKLRDEEYQRSIDVRKKYEEEVKLRKSLQERIESMVKAQAAAK